MFSDLTNQAFVSGTGRTIGNTVVLGKGHAKVLSIEEEVALEMIGELIPRECISYDRCLIGNSIYCTEQYDSNFKRRNSILALGNTFGVITAILAPPKQCPCARRCECRNVIIMYYKLNTVPINLC
jgi:hypothetical protein